MKTTKQGSRERTLPTAPRARATWNGRALRIALLCVTAAVALATTPANARPSDVGGKKNFSCFQANAYIGSELSDILALDPNDPDFEIKLVQQVTQTFGEIVASNPPERMAALAAEIADARPDLVSLNEVTLLEQAPVTPQGPGEFTVVFDYLELITGALEALGAHYKVAVIAPEMDVTLPFVADLTTGQLALARALDRDVILVRTDLPPGFLRAINPQSGKFVTRIQIPEVGLSVDRGWCSVDVLSRGERFRYICSHLETEAAVPIQMAQAQELLAGPANVRMPVVIAGDLNADPLHRNGSPTYDLFAEAGFQDAWLVLNPGDPEGGLTWGHDPFLADPGTEFVWRIDLVLYRAPGFVPTAVEVLDTALDRAVPPLWPSDHAFVAASFNIVNPRALAAKNRLDRLRAR